MKARELFDAVCASEKLAAEIGLSKPDGLSLVQVTDRPPTGYKIRTPFGNCEIMNCQEKDGRYQTVFRATRKQIFNYLKKCGEILK